MNVVTLCTGNVARSVMLGYMLTTLAEATGEDWHVRTAGTHVIEGSAMSGRTRDALRRIDELRGHHFSAHRSHQLTDADVDWADVILASEADHVNFVRANFPDGADRAVQLHQFVRRAPLEGSFDVKLVAVIALGPSTSFDVTDPAGGDQAVYDECARQLWQMAEVFATLVGAASA